MDKDEIWRLLQEKLYSDYDTNDEIFVRQPLLAHYTTLEVLEKIFSTGEIWFSNPLFMNDLDEVRFGIIKGVQLLKEDQSVRDAWKTDERYKKFLEALDYFRDQFEDQHALDTYVFCTSEHDPEDDDGLLSMWRGYGGNGKGVALVFDSSRIVEVSESPLMVVKVKYGSFAERMAWLKGAVSNVVAFVSENDISNDLIYLVSAASFDRIKTMALVIKHSGFREENEWRVIYLPERDTEGKLKPMRSYFNGQRGVEPKLKFRFEALDGVTDSEFSLDRLLNKIILGPSTSSVLAQRSIERMLEVVNKHELADRLVASSIPFRSF